MRNVRPYRLHLVVIGALCLAVVAVKISAMPLSPELVQRLQAEGKLDRYIEVEKAAFAKGFNHPRTTAFLPRTLRADAHTVPDTLHVLVILVDFIDKPANGSYGVYATPEMFDSLLFSHGKNTMGSLTEFYEENSWSKVTVVGDIVGWYRMPQTYAYYCNGQNGFGEYPQNAQKLTEDACVAADPDVDFRKYDVNGDGWEEGIFIVHSGPGAEDAGGGGNLIWSHMGGIYANLVLDGTHIGVYSTEPEESGSGGISPIGVFVHEYGHVLNLPDLYDYEYDTHGIGMWSVMAMGSWGLNGRRPVHFDAWCKYKLGWLDLVEITTNSADLPAPMIELNPVAYRIWKDGQLGPEYFIISNHRRYSFDNSLPGSGMMILHIDETVWGNDDNWHRLVDVEQADGRYDLNRTTNDGDGGDLWSAPAADHFDDQTVPNSRSYIDDTTGVAIFNISEIDSVMAFDAEVAFARPYLNILKLYGRDSAGGDGDGILEAGETIDVRARLLNTWAFTDDVQVKLRVDDPAVTLVDSVAELGPAPPHVIIENTTDPLRFTINPWLEAKIVRFSFIISAGGGTFTRQVDQNWTLGRKQFLVVDADGAANPFSRHLYFTAVLDSLQIPYDYHDELLLGVPDPQLLAQYPCALWFTGDHRTSSVTAADVAVMKSFLDGGGKLLLTGQDIVQHIAALPDTAFVSQYLHLGYGGSPFWGWPFITGVPGDPISGNLSIAVNSSGGAANQTSCDALIPYAGAHPIFYYEDPGGVAGIRYDGPYRVIVLGFGLEGIADLWVPYSTRKQVFAKLWEYWQPSKVPGDFNFDNQVNVVDLVILINHVFNHINLPPGTSGDVNGNCRTDLGDAVYLVNYLYRGGPAPVQPCKPGQ